MFNFGKQLSHIRKEKDLMQKDLAELSGISQQMLSSYEKGFTNPNIETVSKLANALGIHISEFFPSDTVNLYAGEETLINDFRVLNEEHKKLIKQVIAMAKSSSAYLEDSKPE